MEGWRMINIRDIRLIDILPPNIAQDPKVAAAAAALDAELKAVTQAVDQCLFISRLDNLSGPVLDLLARQYHVDFYEPDLPLEQKRSLVKGSLDWHKRKGTPAAVEELITALFDDGQVVEWFDYGGQPYYFKVTTNNPAATQERAQEFIRALNSVKNARSWLEKVEITQTESLSLFYAGVVYTGDNLTIRQVV
jgi:phage tail P2-like protein